MSAGDYVDIGDVEKDNDECGLSEKNFAIFIEIGKECFAAGDRIRDRRGQINN